MLTMLKQRKLENNINNSNLWINGNSKDQSQKDVDKKNEKFSKFESSPYQIMLADNPFLLSGYREDTLYSFKKCFISMFKLHNDTWNIWTHLIGSFIHAYLIYETLYFSSVKDAELESKIVFILFLGLTSFCLFISAIYHLFRTYSVLAYIVLLTCDVSCIAFQLYGSSFMLLFFELGCFPQRRRIYLYFITLLGILTAISVPFLVKYRKTSLRTFLFIVFACTGLVGWIDHFFLVGGQLNFYNIHTLKQIGFTYGWLVLGLVIRRVKLPEILWPGTFDVWFASHQLFHVTNVLGSTSLYWGYRKLFDWEIIGTCKADTYF